MSKRTLILIFLLVAFGAILTFIALMQSVERTQKKQQVATSQQPTPTIDPSLVPDTTLLASPSATLIKVGQRQVIDVNINTGKNLLTTVQLEIGFEPEFLDVTKIEAGPFFADSTVLLNQIDRKTGRATLALGVTTPAQGTGTVARITVVGKKATGTTGRATAINFLQKTQVLGSSNKNLTSLIKQSQGAQIIITNE